MDAINNTFAEMSEHFNTTMAEFQRDLKNASSASNPTSVSQISQQFNSFRAFIFTALESLHMQMKLLSRQADETEMRSRRKILLIHGVAEVEKENTLSTVSKILSEKLKIPGITSDSISRSQRLGQIGANKPRAILVKFKDASHKHKIWFAKKNLKGTGITLSEFLTKCRHDVFLAARQRFGVSRVWTNNGIITVMGSDQSKNRILTKEELDSIPGPETDVESSPSPITANVVRDTRTTQLRARRNVKK